MVPLRAQYNQRKQQNNKKQITLWKPKEHCVQFAVVMYEKKKKKKKRGERYVAVVRLNSWTFF